MPICPSGDPFEDIVDDLIDIEDVDCNLIGVYYPSFIPPDLFLEAVETRMILYDNEEVWDSFIARVGGRKNALKLVRSFSYPSKEEHTILCLVDGAERHLVEE